MDELGSLIASTYAALKTAGQPIPIEPETPKPDKAAIKKSIHPDHLTSFIDGRPYKSLKRHLTTNGMTVSDYRERYGLAKDYPMVAKSYSAQRSELARSLGLGRRTAAEPGEASPKPPKAKTTKPASRASNKPIDPKDETFS